MYAPMLCYPVLTLRPPPAIGGACAGLGLAGPPALGSGLMHGIVRYIEASEVNE